MPRQLNIRSDEAAETPRRLARHLGKTTTEVVVEALRVYNAQSRAPSAKVTTTQVEEKLARLEFKIKQANKIRPHDLTSDHNDLYGSDGLPV